MKKLIIVILITLSAAMLVEATAAEPPQSNSTTAPLDDDDDDTTPSPQLVRVKIGNYISGGVNLHLHCKAEDADFGPQLLRPNGSFEFYFIPNFWALYYCFFRWENGPRRRFDVYDWVRDMNSQYLDWRAWRDGPCTLGFFSMEYDQCYPWEK